METQTTDERAANPALVAMKKAMRTGGRAYLHCEVDASAPDYQRDRALFTLSVDTESPKYVGGIRINQDTQVKISGIPGWIGTGHKDGTRTVTGDGTFRPYKVYSDEPGNLYSPKKGYWSLFACDTFEGVLALLPNHAHVEFRVKLDWYTTQNHVDVGFHGDALILRATWKQGKREIQREFTLCSSVGPHNSARFGNGLGEQ